VAGEEKKRFSMCSLYREKDNPQKNLYFNKLGDDVFVIRGQSSGGKTKVK
jgi:hypothetical protein